MDCAAANTVDSSGKFLQSEPYRKNTNCLSYENLHSKYTKVISENTRIKRKNSSLQKEINSLKQQLETVYGELYKVKKSTDFST